MFVLLLSLSFLAVMAVLFVVDGNAAVAGVVGCCCCCYDHC